MEKMIDFFVLTYNRLKYLNQCVRSVVDQTVDIRINVWNNGSTDETTEWLINHSELLNRGLLFNSPVNLGVADARNVMIDLIDANWIFISDDDMWYDTNCMKYNWEMLQAYENKFGKSKIGFVGLNMPWRRSKYDDEIFIKKVNVDKFEIHEVRTTPPNAWLINKKALFKMGGFKLPPNRLMGYTAFHLPNQLRQNGYKVIRLDKVNGKLYNGCEHTDNIGHEKGFRDHYEEYNEWRSKEKRLPTA